MFELRRKSFPIQEMRQFDVTLALYLHWLRIGNTVPILSPFEWKVRGLVAVEDKGQRKKLLDRCLAESWSTQRLRAAVQNHFGKKKSRGGRTPKPREVPSPVVALQDIQLHARQWMANHKVWFAGRKSALGHVAKRQQTEELHEELGAAVDALNEMQEAVEDGLACLEKLARDIGT